MWPPQSQNRYHGCIVDLLRDQYLELGGNVIGELENTIAVQKKLVEERRRHAQQYRAMIAPFHLDATLTHETLAANQAVLSARKRKETEQYETLRRKSTGFPCPIKNSGKPSPRNGGSS